MKAGRSGYKSSIAFVLSMALLLSFFLPATSVLAAGTEGYTDAETTDTSFAVSEEKDEQISLGTSYKRGSADSR